MSLYHIYGNLSTRGVYKMAKRSYEKALKLKGRTGEPIYDDLGRVVGFVGLEPQSKENPKGLTRDQFERMVSDEAYRGSAFGKAVEERSKDLYQMTPPLEVIPPGWEERHYEDGTSEFAPRTPPRDLFLELGDAPGIEPPSVKPVKRSYTKQYAPPESSETRSTPASIVPPAMAGKTLPAQVSADWNNFVTAAKKIANESGFPLSVILGQAALETGRKAMPGNNFFGIKGTGNAGTQDLATKEADAEGNLYDTRSNFAAYLNPEDSIKAYIDLIRKGFPKAYAERKDPTKMIQEIKRGGYATDPLYVQKVMSTPEFQQYKSYQIPTPQAAMRQNIPSFTIGNALPTPSPQLPPQTQAVAQRVVQPRPQSSGQSAQLRPALQAPKASSKINAQALLNYKPKPNIFEQALNSVRGVLGF